MDDKDLRARMLAACKLAVEYYEIAMDEFGWEDHTSNELDALRDIIAEAEEQWKS